ncbi:MAG: hypothetical protein ACHQNT_04340 [Bacteroidia bacterium]
MAKKIHYGTKYLNMFRAIIAFALDAANVAITNSLLPFKNGIQFIKDTLEQIDLLQADAQKIITGYAAQKRTLRKSAVNITYMITKSVFAYAKNTNNEVLQRAMSFKKKELNQMKIQFFITQVQGAINQVTPLIGSLTDYNITQEMVDNWQQSLDDYTTILASPRTAIAFRKTLNEQIQKLVGQCVHFLSDVMDPLAINLGQQNQQYYQNWRNARRLITDGLQHTKFRVFATNDVDEPVFGITVTQDGTTNTGTTNVTGECTLFINPEGTYTFTITSGSQSISSGPVLIPKGNTITRTFIVQQTGFIIPAPINQPVNENS